MAFLGIGGSKGRSRSRAGRVRQEWQDLGFAAPDGKPAGRDWFESALNSDGIDELGFTAGLPGSHIAPDVDLLSRAKVARRNDLLASTGMAQAQNYLGSAAEALSAYRPGGAAALLSGLASQQAQTALQGNLARRTEAPGLMFRYTEQVRKSAERKARNAAIAQSVIGLASAGLGAAIGGIGGAAAPAVAGATQGAGGAGTQTFQGGVGATTPGGPVAETLVPGQSSGAGQQVGSQASAGPGQSPQKSVAGGSPGIQTARGPVTAPGRGPAGAGAPGPAPGGGPAPAGGAGPAGAPGPLRRGEVTRRFGDSSMAASPSQAGFAMDTGLPADVIDTLAWAMATGDEPLSTADLFSAELDFMMSSSLLRVG